MANGDPIARGTIELGANTAPMEAALTDAKGKAVESAKQTENAVQDAREKVKQERAARIAAEEVARAATQVQTATQPASQAAESFGKRMQKLTEPLRATVGAFTAIMGSFTAIVAIGGTVAGVFIAIGKALTAKADAAKAAAAELAKFQRQLEILRNSDVTEALDPDPEGTAIKKRYAERLEAEYDLTLKAAMAAEKAGNKRRAEEILADGKATELRLRDEEQKELKSAETRWRLRQGLAKQAEEDAEKARLDAVREADDALQEERKRDMEELMGYWTDIQNKADADRAAAQRDLMRQQAEQLAQLRNDINALYSSGNLEVGIGRVASLLETLIAKTEGRR